MQLDNIRLKKLTSYAYEAVVVNTADYYPGGMIMPERHTQDIDYRYAYNGMETDNEVKGNGNSYTTEFRQYDPRLGRWLSLDPLMAKYPLMSPYVAFNNNPIFFVDPLGLEGGPAKELFKLPEIDETNPDGDDTGVVITANRSTSSDKFNKWLEKSGGADFIREVQNALFESKKVQGNNNNLGRLAYGTNSLGLPDYSSVILGKWKQEAEREAIYAIHALYAEEMSGVDPNGLNYLLNPIASGRFDLWLLDAASSPYEKNMIKAGMIFDIVVLAVPIAKGVKTSIKAGKQILRRSISMGTKKGVSTAAKTGLTNAEARAWYYNQVKSLNTSVAPTKENAMILTEKRNILKVQTRAMMADRNAAALLDKNYPIRSFEYYVEKYSAQGYSGESLWQRIIEGSSTSNAGVNARFGIK